MEQRPKATLLKKLTIISLCVALFLVFLGVILFFFRSTPASALIAEIIYGSGVLLWAISLIFTIVAKCRREPVKIVFVAQLIAGVIILYAVSFAWATIDVDPVNRAQSSKVSISEPLSS